MTDFLTIDGLRIAYTVAGSPAKPPILFLHGIMSHRGVWAWTTKRLERDYYCIAIDHVGFGDSDKPKEGDYTIARQAGRALKVADHFGLERFILAGHSMGGQIATYLAASLAPERVKKLVSVDGVVTGALSDYVQRVTRRLVAIGNRLPSSYALSRMLVEWKPFGCWMFGPWFYEPKKLPFDLWRLDRQKAMNSGIAHSTPKAWDSLNAADLTPILKNIVAPTLVLFGAQDGTVPVEQAHIFKDQLPSARLELIQKCGHFPMYEKFDEYIAVLERFLGEP
jgi:2-hydroxy-6-oxonona-2,4-dienedioate hydrolase